MKQTILQQIWKHTCVDMAQDTADGRAQDLLAARCHSCLQASLPLILGSLQPPFSLLVAIFFTAAVLAAALLLTSMVAVTEVISGYITVITWRLLQWLLGGCYSNYLEVVTVIT